MKPIKKKLLLLKWELEHRIPEPIKFWKEFISLPAKKILYKNTGLKPGDWNRSGFLCLCDKHVEEFKQEGDADAGSTIGYYVCDRKGCGRTADTELFPGLKKALEDFVEKEPE